MARKKSLFVVTNKGRDVIEAKNFIDAFIMKFGLTNWVELLRQLLEMVLAQVDSYALLTVAREFLDQIVEMMAKFLKRIDPLLAFSLFQNR